MSDVVYRGNLPSAAERARRVRRYGVWYGVEHFLLLMRAYGWSVLGYALGQPWLYLVAMGMGLGSLVGAHGQTVDGVRYITFVAPAILLSTIVMSTSGELTYPVLGGFKWEKTYHATAATPMQPGQIALGHLCGVLLRFLFQAAVFWGVMLLFGVTNPATGWLQIPIALLTAAAFGAPLQAFASTLKGEGGSFNYIYRFVLNPMFLFAGTYFPLESMPRALQWIGWISPLWHGTVLARVASYGSVVPAWRIALHVAVLVACAAAGVVWAYRSYTRRLHS